MIRRVFIDSLTSGLLAAPLGAEAQQTGKVPVIGYLMERSGPTATFAQAARTLRQELVKLVGDRARGDVTEVFEKRGVKTAG